MCCTQICIRMKLQCSIQKFRFIGLLFGVDEKNGLIAIEKICCLEEMIPATDSGAV